MEISIQNKSQNTVGGIYEMREKREHGGTSGNLCTLVYLHNICKSN